MNKAKQQKPKYSIVEMTLDRYDELLAFWRIFIGFRSQGDS